MSITVEFRFVWPLLHSKIRLHKIVAFLPANKVFFWENCSAVTKIGRLSIIVQFTQMYSFCSSILPYTYVVVVIIIILKLKTKFTRYRFENDPHQSFLWGRIECSFWEVIIYHSMMTPLHVIIWYSQAAFYSLVFHSFIHSFSMDTFFSLFSSFCWCCWYFNFQSFNSQKQFI